MTAFAKLSSPTKEPKRRPARMPDGLVVHAVGDIHGRDDLLRELAAKLVGEWREGSDAQVKPVLVFLGDYIDRGPGSDAVIEYLLSDALAAFETRFLRGNHEAMLLDFLQNGVAGPHWAQIGGADTLRAYGVTPPDRQFDAQAWEQARTKLAGRLPDTHLRFFETLERFAVYGDYCFVHALSGPGEVQESGNAASGPG